MTWEWLVKNSSTLMFLASVIGWVWVTAMAYAKIKEGQEKVKKLEDWSEQMEKSFDAHDKNVVVHRDPIRDEQRLRAIENGVKHLDACLERKFETMIKLLTEIKSHTRGLP